ncbi:hypothetical protein DPQ25_07655 [Hydrogeniiclostridium mannosilyticum]|uniref:Plasmid segregation centromere-binding protein ParR n=1 Tax=Hydrogeniiclostridium mannosilyticum TaxID=2764322 RepID=A0A328UFZ2_9FIRM|nr:hypothetical protein [Hydrogeniiclostridium mannosilyticum]RAQ28665.1 hypothetical protein DPQ25_07655 [Hydrogeniiclostridium mannosilyticum]
MPEKKEQNKFTIQFSLADPAHRQVIDILNQQGRRKAQFLVNAVQHYLHCPETPDIPQAASLDLHVVEDIVRRIMQEQYKPASVNPTQGKKQENHPKTESVHYDETAELLGKEGLAAIANTMAAFRKG